MICSYRVWNQVSRGSDDLPVKGLIFANTISVHRASLLPVISRIQGHHSFCKALWSLIVLATRWGTSKVMMTPDIALGLLGPCSFYPYRLAQPKLLCPGIDKQLPLLPIGGGETRMKLSYQLASKRSERIPFCLKV